MRFPRSRRLTLVRIATALFAITLIGLFVAGIDPAVDFSASGYVGVRTALNSAGETVLAPMPGLAADEAGVRPGEVLISIDGAPVPPQALRADVARQLMGAPGSGVRLDLRGQDGTLRTVTLTRDARLLALAGLQPGQYAAYFAALDAFVMLVSCAVGAILIWRKPDDGMAYLAALVLVMLAAGNTTELAALRLARPDLAGLLAVVGASYSVVLLLFWYIFPNGRFVPGWTRYLLLVALVWSVMKQLPAPYSPWAWPFFLGSILDMGMYLTGLYAQVYRYRRVSTQTERQQTKWVVFGVTVAFIGIYGYYIPQLLTADLQEPSVAFLHYRLIGQTLSYLALLVLPVSVGISILRFRLWDIDPIINLSLVYSALTVALTAVYLSVTLLLQRAISSALGAQSELLVVGSTVLIVLLFRPLQSRIQNGVDRLFFRQRYDSARALEAFGQVAKTEVDQGRLTERMRLLIDEALHPESIAFWLRAAPGQGPAGYAQLEAPANVVPANDALVQSLRAASGAQRIGQANIDVDVNSDAGRALSAMGTALLVPLISQSELLGWLALGPRRSEQEYSLSDRQWLNSIAAQAGPALRVAQLVSEREADLRRREQVEQELRVAQVVQKTLLPEGPPALEGWRFQALYKPASEVSGDFYDLIPLPDGRIALVIGDATGKGVPAALVMATSRAILRTAAQYSHEPAKVLDLANQLLCADVRPGTFVTCLFAVLDPASGALQFANAGHNTPYLALDGSARELRATGMPLGLIPELRYDQCEASIPPCARLLLYSDGLVEAHNAAGEMFGFARLAELTAERSPVLIEHLVRSLEAFTGPHREQEDDLTMLVVERG